MTVKGWVRIALWVLVSFLGVGLNFSALSTFKLQPEWRQILAIVLPLICFGFTIFGVWNELPKKTKSSADELLNELKAYRAERSWLVDEIDATITQIDKIREKIDQLMVVLKRNKMKDGFEYTIQIARNTQDILFDSIRVLLNKITICDKDMYPAIRSKIEEIMMMNEGIVDTFNQFLVAVSNMKNNYSVNQRLSALRNLTATLDQNNGEFTRQIEIKMEREMEKV